MAQVAAAAGVAKATLYNHFRTREAVLHALLVDEVSALAEHAAGQPLPDALAGAARAISEHPLLATLMRIEPGTVAALGRIDRTTDGWRTARAAVDAALAADGRAGGALVLRWLASFVLSPAAAEAITADATALVAALPGTAEVAASA
jgi:AcrR family transcriptional regulator